MDSKSYSRRGFIGKCAGVAMSIGVIGVILNSCSNANNDKGESTGFNSENCDDYSGLSASDLERRKMLNYVDISTVPGNHCENCANYLPPKPGEKCGGCALFKGPVRSTGYCTQYAPKSQNDG
ncbi:MAG: high-potential iron-sulfur protein [Chitinophagaceae bacterium]|nr:MAG: high-potential iron-sulfur protein [Chitinophagaceae bacterium]